MSVMSQCDVIAALRAERTKPKGLPPNLDGIKYSIVRPCPACGAYPPHCGGALSRDGRSFSCAKLNGGVHDFGDTCKACGQHHEANSWIRRYQESIAHFEARKRAAEPKPVVEPPKPVAAPEAEAPPRPAVPFDHARISVRGMHVAAAEALHSRAPFAVNRSGRLFRYDTKRGVYRPVGFAEVGPALRDLLDEICAAAKLTQRLTAETEFVLRTLAQLLWEKPSVDRINLANGVLNLQTMKLEPHSPDWRSPMQIPVRYDPGASCPKWDQFLSQVLPADAIALAWELAGWTLAF